LSEQLLDKNIVVTGVLGGLGSAIAKQALAEGKDVLGFDNFDPGSAPLTHQKYKMYDLDIEDNFSFVSKDIRLLNKDVAYTLENYSLWFHCTNLSPFRRAVYDSSLINEMCDSSIFDIVNKNPDSKHVIIQHSEVLDKDIRVKDKNWQELLESEKRLRDKLKDNKKVSFVLLPALVGKGQSPRTFPLRQMIQHNSGTIIELPEQSETVEVLALDDTVKKIWSILKTLSPKILTKENFEENIFSLDLETLYKDYSNLNPRDEEPELSRSLPAWNYSSENSHSEEKCSSLIDELTEEINKVPHFPPFKWQIALKKEERMQRAIRRKKRKQRKSKSK